MQKVYNGFIVQDLHAGKHYFHLIGLSSSTMKRVCRATLQAEAHALQCAVESGDKIRALLCELLRKIAVSGDRHLANQKVMKHVYYSDCRSLTDHLQSEVPRKMQDKRLGIELASLRQGIWADGELTHQVTKLPGSTPAASWPIASRNPCDLTVWSECSM